MAMFFSNRRMLKLALIGLWASYRRRIMLGVWVSVVVAIVVVLLVWPGWARYWDTGLEASFSPPTKGRIFYPAKTLWDWLQLLVVPLVLAASALWFNWTQQRRERGIAQDNRRVDLQIAETRQQDSALETYLSEMATLLLDKALRESREGAEVRGVARAQSLTVLRRLDGAHKGVVVQFLYESLLITKDGPVVALHGADLSGADLHLASLVEATLSAADLRRANLSLASLIKADLRGVDLSGANLQGANLHLADLRGAFLSVANLRRAKLQGADLRGATLNDGDLSGAHLIGAKLEGVNLIGTHLPAANLNGANLSGAFLSRANLRGANLQGAKLNETDLRETYLRDADLSGADLCDADLSGADLCDADLSGADLCDADLRDATGVTDAEIEHATSLLSGTTLPSGTKHR